MKELPPSVTYLLKWRIGGALEQDERFVHCTAKELERHLEKWHKRLAIRILDNGAQLKVYRCLGAVKVLIQNYYVGPDHKMIWIPISEGKSWRVKEY